MENFSTYINNSQRFLAISFTVPFITISLDMARKASAALSPPVEGFTGEEEITLLDLQKCIVRDRQNFQDGLPQYNGGLAVAPVFTLSVDNAEVLAASLMMTGVINLSSKKRKLSVYANTSIPDLFITFKSILASRFTFENSPISNLLDSEHVAFTISLQDGSEISPEELSELGALDFSLKAFVVPISGNSCYVSVSVFPGNVSSIDAAHTPRHEDPRFPGLHLYKQTDVPLGARAEHITTKQYSAPIFPVLVTSSSIHDPGSRNGPSRETLLYSIYSIMSRTTIPVCAREHASLKTKYEAIPETGALPSNKVTFRWPTAKRPDVNQGKT